MKLENRNYGANSWTDEAEWFYADLMGETVGTHRRKLGFQSLPREDWAGEAAVGNARIAGHQYLVGSGTPILHRGTSLDAVLLWTLARRAGHSVVLGDAVGGSRFTVHSWGSTTSLPSPRTIEFDATGVAVLIINGGARVYVQANPTASSQADKLLWVHVPSLEEFLRLPNAQRTSQRNAWVLSIRRARVRNPATRAAFTTTELAALATPVLRILFAHNAARTLHVGTVNRRGMDRGGVVNGVTLPMLRYPITEPHVYLRVISMVEGKMESINAWDTNAGISLGPIQINVQRAALFRFLWSVWQADRNLFTATLGVDWTMRNTNSYLELSVPIAGRSEWLRGRSANADALRNYAYFQSGDPTRSALSQIDPEHRRRLARRFAGLIAWPHIQELLEDTSAWWLQRGLDQIHAAGIPALDPDQPDRDLFILKLLLMSTYVRFSGCLASLLTALERWSTVSDKLANWQTALASMGGMCSAGGDNRQRARNTNLRQRLGDQQRHAATVFPALQAIIAARRTATLQHPSKAASSGSISLDPRNAADLFDRVAAGDELAADEVGLRVLARPGEIVPLSLPERTFMLTRALGEGRFAVLRAVREVAPGEWEMEGLHVPFTLRSAEILSRDRLLVEQRDAELITRCGFFGPNVQRTEQRVREAVRDAALTEKANWHTAAGVPQSENVMAMFGHLVRYYLSTIRQVQPDTLTAIQTTANGPINYGPIPVWGATSAVINTWAARIRGLLLAGAPNTGVPANLAMQVSNAVKFSRHAHFNRGAFRAWSAAWVTACVRGAGIRIGIEAMIQGNHSGRDELLLATSRHAEYTLEAHRRSTGTNRKNGSYHAFSPTARAPKVGDIIVQDRQAVAPHAPLTFAQINALAGGRELHGDIVIEVGADYVVTLGGNVGNSCRQRRYPLDSNKKLVVARNQLYVNENDSGVLPNFPSTTTENLHSRSTLRIFTLLSPVQVCATVPGQPYSGGILT